MDYNKYSNTVIYKIACKNPEIQDIYIGHTTNFLQRKREHFKSFKDANNSRKIYEFMRKNGGWENWEMVVIEHFPCETRDEARARERFWCDELAATLNQYSPFLKDKKEWVACCNRWVKADPERYKALQKKYHLYRKEARRFLTIVIDLRDNS